MADDPVVPERGVLTVSVQAWDLAARRAGGWMGEVQDQRIVAEARMRRQGSGRQRMTAEEVTRVVSSLRI